MNILFQSFLENQLNKEQLAATLHTTGPSLILAGAGSGKTRVLTYKIANLVYGHGVHPRNILAVTFTNKASHEMKERVQKIQEEIQQLSNKNSHSKVPPLIRGGGESGGVGQQELDFDSLLSKNTSNNNLTSGILHFTLYKPTDFFRIGTFHSVFLKILKQDIEHLGMSYSKNFGVYDLSDTNAVAKKVLKELNLTEIIELNDMKGTISRWKNSGRLPEQAVLHCESRQEEWILKAYQGYQKSLEQANMLDFDDLLLLTKHLFENNTDILKKRQSQFRYILVDEAQDTNAIQFTLMKMLAPGKANITFIGDDYQSIYRRRGAVMEQFLDIKSIWPTIETFKLQTNYRSLPHIVEAGNAIIKQNKKQYEKTIISHRKGGQHIRCFEYADEKDEALQTINFIIKIKEEQNKKRADFTILYRTNSQSQPFEQVLLTEGIPYKVIGAQKFFERAEIKDMLGYIKFLINHHDDVSLRRIINVPRRNIGDTTIEEIQALATQRSVSMGEILHNIYNFQSFLKPAVFQKIGGFLHELQAIKQIVDLYTPSDILKQIYEITRYKDYIIKVEGTEKGEEKIANIGQLITMATKWEETGIEGLGKFMDEVALLTSVEDAQPEDADAVRLMTIHASKGLEFPYVFIVGCEDGIFPLEKAKFDDDEMEEERRGMYVAITRAKDHLFMSYANSRYQRGQIRYNRPSRFLEEIPEHLIKNYNLGTASRKQENKNQFSEGTRVSHKLFGSGTVIEAYDDISIVKFDNKMVNMRRVENKLLNKS